MSFEQENSDRRVFLKKIAAGSLGLWAALNFGQAIAQRVPNHARIACVYATRYGATRDNAEWIASGINQDVSLFDIEIDAVDRVVADYDFVIVGSGVWREGVHAAIKSFVADYADHLTDKLIASFVVCGTQANSEKNKKRIEGYFAGMHESLPRAPHLYQALGGRLRVDQLNEEDRAKLTRFYTKVLKRELESWDRTDKQAALSFASKVHGRTEQQHS